MVLSSGGVANKNKAGIRRGTEERRAQVRDGSRSDSYRMPVKTPRTAAVTTVCPKQHLKQHLVDYKMWPSTIISSTRDPQRGARRVTPGRTRVSRASRFQPGPVPGPRAETHRYGTATIEEVRSRTHWRHSKAPWPLARRTPSEDRSSSPNSLLSRPRTCPSRKP